MPENRPAQGIAVGVGVGAIGSLPIVGGMVAGGLSAAIASKQREQDEEFWAWTAARLRAVEGRLASVFDPTDDEFFVSAQKMIRASRETADRDKRRLLAEVLVESGSWSAVPYGRRERYIDLVVRLTPWHVRLLSYFRDPADWFRRQGLDQELSRLTGNITSIAQVMEQYVVPESVPLRLLVADLEREQLVDAPLATIMSGSGTVDSRTTTDGDAFLRFLNDAPSASSPWPGPGVEPSAS